VPDAGVRRKVIIATFDHIQARIRVVFSDVFHHALASPQGQFMPENAHTVDIAPALER
jgi:hypothetical protein